MPTDTANPFAGLDEIVQEHAPLAPLTWYRIGGPARYLVRPRTPDELGEVARRCVAAGVRMRVLGLGANVLVADAGTDAAVIRLDADHWRAVTVSDDGAVSAGAGADLQKLVLRTARAGLTGLEPLAGIPASVGGAVRMNAGGRAGDLGAVVRTVTVMDAAGRSFDRTTDDLVFGYRRANITAPFILGATLALEPDDPERVTRRLKENWMYKRNSQPLAGKSCGCVFKNPRGGSAGALIDAAGLKGARVGGAEVSRKHANFIVADPGCRAADVLALIGTIRRTVADRAGVELESEVQVWE